MPRSKMMFSCFFRLIRLIRCAAVSGVSTSILIGAVAIPAVAGSQQLKYAVSIRDTTNIRVALRVPATRDTVVFALPQDPEYDDRYYRYVRDLVVTANGVKVPVTRVDSLRWRASVGKRGPIDVRYRIELPAQTSPNRNSWRPFVRSTGALIGGANTFIFPEHLAKAPVTIALDLPKGWRTASSMRRVGREYRARDIGEVVDAPILAGNYKEWTFRDGGRVHRIVYWPVPGGPSIDSFRLATLVKGIVHGAFTIFTSAPYPDYTFLLQDAAVGALEHRASLTEGIPAAVFIEQHDDFADQMAHEYFHAWNNVFLRPHGREEDVRTTAWPPNEGKWWSEGVTLYYADVILRRGKLYQQPVDRLERLRDLIEQYLNSPGAQRISPEVASREVESPAGTIGDYEANPWLQGQLIATALDLMTRDSTRDRRTLDHVMRSLVARLGGKRGFVTQDIAREVRATCQCALDSWVMSHVHDAKPIDFTDALRVIGQQLVVDTVRARDEEGHELPDTRFWGRPAVANGPMLVALPTPESPWAKAGIHSGDTLVALNDTRMTAPRQLFGLIRSIKVGDTLSITVRRGRGEETLRILVAPYDRIRVQLRKRQGITKGETSRMRRWTAGW